MSEKLTSLSTNNPTQQSFHRLRMAFVADEPNTIFGRRPDFAGWSSLKLTSQVTATVGNIIASTEEVGYTNGSCEWTGDENFIPLHECDSCDHKFQSGEQIFTKTFGKIREHICSCCADKRDLK